MPEHRGRAGALRDIGTHVDRVAPRQRHDAVHEVALLHKQRAHLRVDCPAGKRQQRRVRVCVPCVCVPCVCLCVCVFHMCVCVCAYVCVCVRMRARMHTLCGRVHLRQQLCLHAVHENTICGKHLETRGMQGLHGSTVHAHTHVLTCSGALPWRYTRNFTLTHAHMRTSHARFPPVLDAESCMVNTSAMQHRQAQNPRRCGQCLLLQAHTRAHTHMHTQTHTGVRIHTHTHTHKHRWGCWPSHSPVHDSGCKDGQEAQHQLHLLHLCSAAVHAHEM